MKVSFATCIDRLRITGDAHLALNECNRLNETSRSHISRAEAASEWHKRWEEREIVIRFLDGSHELRQRVQMHAEQWLQHANLRFQWANSADAHIKISFQDRMGGYWSYVGKDALQFPGDQATMNFGGWNDATLDNDVEIKRVVLHEFGHMLGLIHEHQAPQHGIPWDVQKVLMYYNLTQGWSPEETYAQVLYRYSFSTVRSTRWDPKSIMQYPVEPFLTTDRSSVGWNNELSPMDIEFVKKMYP